MKFQYPEGGRTLVYSTIDGHEICMDYYLPPATGSLSAIIYYHGGGMTAGSRRGGPYPKWLYQHCQDDGYIFISADYRLCHPSNTIDQIDDARALFSFLASHRFASQLPDKVSLDTTRIAVAGFSAGAYSARAACLYAEPKPAALLSVFGLGGNLLLDHWTRARPPTSLAKHFDMAAIPTLLADRTVVSEGSQDRFPLTIHWEIQGTFLDGIFQSPGLGAKLNALPYEERFNAVPDRLKAGVLHNFVTESYPPSVFVHGSSDEVVSPEESRYQHEQLENLGVKSQLHLIENGPHGLEGIRQSSDSQIYRDSTAAYNEALAFIDAIFSRA
ncbi:alpha/beta-hydrolase [Aspergillus pseudoustus]|uniref:Alpha/beta-hydrolase n=1 Tax=Aspergillus pseudoustus TaxID=1810923 RepID=A0ABR4JXQ4_9EURO